MSKSISNPFARTASAVTSIVAGMRAQVEADPEAHVCLRGKRTRNGVNSDTLSLLRKGSTEAIDISFSVGTGGKGNSRLDLRGDQVGSVVEKLLAFDPSASESTDLPDDPALAVERTICVEEVKDSENVVSFKLSLKPNTRAIRVPVSEWPAFLAFMGEVDQWTDLAVSHYQGYLNDLEGGEGSATDASEGQATE